MNKKTTVLPSADQLVDELFKELKSINRDITALRSRLESGLTKDEDILQNHRYLMEAIALRNEIITTLKNEYSQTITLERLMFDIQNS